MDVRLSWLALFTATAIGVTACAAGTSTSPDPTPSVAPSSMIAKGDLPVVAQQPSSASTDTSTTSAPPTLVVVPVPVTSILTAVPYVPPTVVDPGTMRAVPTRLRPVTPGTTTSAPANPQPACTPGVTPTPVIRDVYPSQGPIQGGTDVNLIGSNLNLGPGTLVSFGNVTVPPYGVTDALISVTAPPGAAGPVTVRLFRGGCQATGTFTYLGSPAPPAPPAPATAPATNGPCPGGSAQPQVTGLNPRQLKTEGGEPVRISGHGFATGSGQTAVLFGSTPVTPTSITSTQIDVVSPPGPAGPLTIKVAIPQGCTSYSGADVKYYVPRPVITSVSPTRGPKAGGTTVIVTGKYLSNASVRIASTAATVTANTDTSLTVIVPAFRNTGQAAFSVSTPGGSAGVLYTYTP